VKKEGHGNGLIIFGIAIALVAIMSYGSLKDVTTTNVTIVNGTPYNSGPSCLAGQFLAHCSPKVPVVGGLGGVAALANGSCPDGYVVMDNDTCLSSCCASCGYSWCDSTQSCIRAWETPCANGTAIVGNTTTTTLASCGGFTGRGCQSGYDCVMPVGVDQLGVCKLHPSCAVDADCPQGEACHQGTCALPLVIK
jgi:hypothetical protein